MPPEVRIHVNHLVMTEALPIGIITNTENISSDIEAIDRVDVEDLAQLWRGTKLPIQVTG